MSTQLSNLAWNEHGDPVMTLTITGVHDVFRFAHHLTRGQCEFADVGQRVLRRLKRRMGSPRYGAYDESMHGTSKRYVP